VLSSRHRVNARLSRSSGQGQGHASKSVSVSSVCGWTAFDCKEILFRVIYEAGITTFTRLSC